ncbi:c-type cytochrome biogenesis protein CcmI [Falsirhodobacter algicola]|uniref:C-type cytochrome biogenesis protein CcmI n=1 Tax=Falsirhodobacter algicola TaxID=2692330 RepID=A0A8J8MRD5_9RHOB|nr:c-type cytochrome biogenesis protein CcmI [Falsirhodobacter algicola]QUS35330.1 c-type cytochrome biogenesis protein CcmI [Falsirhodobacter algicola]
MQNWIFWAIIGCLCLAVAATLIRALLVRGGDDEGSDLRFYRAQLTDITRDLERGTLMPDEADRLRLEISRRLLDADRAAGAKRARGRGAVLPAAILVAVCVAAAVPFYLRVGAPGYADAPFGPRIDAIEAARAARPDQAEAERRAPAPQTTPPDPELAGLMDQLRQAVARNPDDLRGQRLLAENEAALANYSAAAEAQQQIARRTGDAQDYALAAQYLGYAAGGYLSPEAEALLDRALSRDPREPLALFLSGLMMAQGGREDVAFRLWRRALEVGPPDAAWRPQVLAAMPDIAARAGVRWTAPDDLPPGADAIRSLAPDAQSEAITGMVEGLAARLAATGGDADEWAQLIRAYGVLGRTDDARAAFATAKASHDDPADLDILQQAAIAAGVSP